MQIELTHEMAMKLVEGSSPYYDLFDKYKNIGQWIGGFVDRWDWNGAELSKLTTEELYAISIECKESWLKPRVYEPTKTDPEWQKLSDAQK